MNAADRIRWHREVEAEGNAEVTIEQQWAEKLHALLSSHPSTDEIHRVLRIAYITGYNDALRADIKRMG